MTKLENAAGRQMESKTSGAKLYETTLCDLNVGVIDSPGFGDSRGLEQDKLNAGEIVKVLSSEEYVNCICLIINCRTPVITATLKYVLKLLPSYPALSLTIIIIVVFTNCADTLDITFDVRALE